MWNPLMCRESASIPVAAASSAAHTSRQIPADRLDRFVETEAREMRASHKG